VKLRVTERGLRAFLTLGALGLFYLASGDIFFLHGFLFLCGILLVCLIDIVVKGARFSFSIEPDVLEIKVKAGEYKDLLLNVKSSVECFLESSAQGFSFFPNVIFPELGVVRLKVGAELSGKYVLNSLRVYVKDFLSIFKRSFDVKVDYVVFVYPRSFFAALELLKSAGVGRGAEAGSVYAGRGRDEYAWSREYVYGDDIRDMDWKGSARLGKLLIKEYFSEGACVCVVFDARVPGPVTLDRLTAAFLSAVAKAVREGYRVLLLVYDGRRVDFSERPLSGADAAKAALGIVLRARFVPLQVVDVFYDTSTVRDSARLYALSKSRGVKRILETELKSSRDFLRAVASIVNLLKEEDSVTFLTSFSGDMKELLECIDRLYNRGVKIEVVVFSKSWIDSGGKEAEERFNRALEIIKKRNISIKIIG